jgi:hypothetical protein
VTQHEDLDVFRCIGAGEQRQPAQHPSEHQVGESEGHSWRSSCLAVACDVRVVTANTLIRGHDSVLGTQAPAIDPTRAVTAARALTGVSQP